MDRAAMPGVVCVSLLLIKRIKNLKSHGLESNSESDPSGSWRKSFVGRLLLHWSCVWNSTNDPHLPEVNAAGDIDVFDSIFWCITRCGTRTIGDNSLSHMQVPWFLEGSLTFVTCTARS